ncbi:MAG TPA: hypothetical protein VFE47_10565 [Tepidisphaeraceae bacterium]|jgi:hypothetical protein|nr:hypothetical protein [Tepidisphaeraceae bacterium]
MAIASDHLHQSIATQTFGERLKEISMFFDATDRIHQTMRRVAGKLDEAGIAYALVGGMAVNAHRHPRTTGDVDFLITLQGIGEFVRTSVPGQFDPYPGNPRRFVDRTTGVTFGFLITGRFPGSGKPGPIAYPDPISVSQTIDNTRVVNLQTLIELKLAAGRHKDFGDVVELIRVHNLDESFLPKIHAAVHGDFIECLEEKRREDEYEACESRAFEKILKPDLPPSGE